MSVTETYFEVVFRNTFAWQKGLVYTSLLKGNILFF